MKAFITFCKKELLESWRTHKLIILLAVFAGLGILSPLIAKLMPEILNGVDLGGTGIAITVPDPTALDSWSQFFSNMGQMGLLAMVIVFCGLMSNEFSKGTLVNMLTKGMKRHIVILAKFLVASVIWIVCYLVCLGVTWSYTAFFWESIPLPYAFLTFSAPLAYGLLLLALMMLGGILFKTYFGSLMLTGGAVVVLTLLNLSPKLHKYNPISLGGETLYLLTGQRVPGDFIPALVICLGLTAVLIVFSIFIFNRKPV